MFRSNSPYGYDNSSYADSLRSTDFSVDETSSQISNLSRPSAKSIYLQRKEYAESMNKQMGSFQYRVEHLFTCDVDGREVCGLEDCIERLKLLDAMGRVWGQDMILEVQGRSLLLTDIETQEELESLALSSIMEIKAVLGNDVYNSLLIMAVQDRSKRDTSVFMFQCESLRADYVKRDLERAFRNKKEGGDQNNLRGNLGAVKPPLGPAEWALSEPPLEWGAPDYDDSPPPTPPIPRKEPVFRTPELPPQPPSPQPPPGLYTEQERKVDILNHVLNDIELFMDRVASVAPPEDKKKKKKKKKKKNKAIKGMPSVEEFESCLQKIKFGFNLLAELNGQINDPSPPDLIHCLFTILGFLVNYSPKELPPSIVAPLLTPECIRFLSEEATSDEDQLWQSLGDAWNIPCTKWPEDDEDIPIYTLVFDDGWQPPALSPDQPERTSMRRQENQRSVPEQNSKPWKSPTTSSIEELPPSCMRVLFDFTARNQRELSISKGEVVQLLDMSKQWWKVRNDRREEGYVPNNALESLDKRESKEEQGPPTLTKKSKADDVKLWLEYRGFSKITVRCLGVLSGSMLLGMTREELKIVCPEEGGRIFFQLQNIKSAIALASEVRRIE